MTTVSRVNTVTHSSVSGGGEWDHRLNRLLEDLQETVVPPETRANASEYREYRMTSSTRNNDEPASQTDEKWVEYGTRHPAPGFSSSSSHHNHTYNIDSGLQALTDSAYGSSSRSTTEKTVNFSDQNFSKSFTSSSGGPSGFGPSGFNSSIDKSQSSRVEYLTPANTTTLLKSGPSSPSNTLISSSTSPKVERKEYFAKASYTTLIKGGGPGEVTQVIDSRDSQSDRLLQDLMPRNALPDSFSSRQTTTTGGMSSSMSETKRTYTSESTRNTVPDLPPPAIGQPLYSSTPLKSTNTSSYRSELNSQLNSINRSVTPPPKPAEGLKTPPLVRKILQQSASSSSNYNSSKTTSGAPLGRPPLSSSPVGGIPSYDEPPPEPKGARYYTSTTTTEHRENRELSPVKRFPSPQPPRDNYGGSPKRLDELMATFEDSSYTSTRHIQGDGGGPHGSHPYGPGTHHVERPITQTRTVRIDESATTRRIIDDTETDLHQRKSSQYQNPAYGGKDEPSRNVSGPPVFYPSNQIFPKTEEDALLSQDKKKDKKEPKKDKYKASKPDDKGSGAVPVPVCLPVCCAAPCSIM